MSPAEIASIPIQHGNRQRPLGDLFKVNGSAKDDLTLIWQGDCSRVKRIGVGMSEGTILVEQSAGNHLGAEMSGGRIEVQGNAADWVGAEMKGERFSFTEV
ncbi:MAG: hypothetical protein R3C11_21010 [Planctomycetaceae bacterium]